MRHGFTDREQADVDARARRRLRDQGALSVARDAVGVEILRERQRVAAARHIRKLRRDLDAAERRAQVAR